MFNEETCQLCGKCLSECPIMEMEPEKARTEMIKAVETRSYSESFKYCIGCAYCDTICPTQSNPSALRKALIDAHTRQGDIKEGVRGMGLICEEVPTNMMAIALEYEREEKEKNLEIYTHPPKSKTVFYLGCSLSYIYTDLAKTALLKDFPVIGGMKYCCGGYVNRSFGEKESKIKGQQLLARFNETGIKKVITFCPGCDNMLQNVYPGLVEGFDIKVQNIAEYLLEKHRSGKLVFPHKLNQTITFQDSCGWRNVDNKIYEAPRQLLQAMGAEVVEMKHNRKQSMCCGGPLANRNPALADKVAGKRTDEAKAAGATAVAVSCTGCFALTKKAAEQHMDVFNITELAQIAVGETPHHRITEVTDQLRQNMMKTFTENPSLLKDKYIIENGEVRKL